MTIFGATAAKDRDITLSDIKPPLAEKGIQTSIDGLWRFFKRDHAAIFAEAFRPRLWTTITERTSSVIT